MDIEGRKEGMMARQVSLYRMSRDELMKKRELRDLLISSGAVPYSNIKGDKFPDLFWSYYYFITDGEVWWLHREAWCDHREAEVKISGVSGYSWDMILKLILEVEVDSGCCVPREELVNNAELMRLLISCKAIETRVSPDGVNIELVDQSSHFWFSTDGKKWWFLDRGSYVEVSGLKRGIKDRYSYVEIASLVNSGGRALNLNSGAERG